MPLQAVPRNQDSERTRAQLDRIEHKIDALIEVLGNAAEDEGDRIHSIEAKLDTLIQALAAESEDDEPTHDLDGNTLYRNREEGQTL